MSTGLPGSDLFLIIQLFEKINQSSIASCSPLGCLTKLGNFQLDLYEKKDDFGITPRGHNVI